MAHDEEGARRALEALDRLDASGKPLRGPAAVRLRKEVAAGRNDEDSDDHHLARRLGASFELLQHDPRFSLVWKEMVDRDRGDSEGFWHNEVLLHVAATLRLAGLDVAPQPGTVRGASPDLHDGANLYIENKTRADWAGNDFTQLKSRVRKALAEKQIRRKDPAAVEVVFLDLGRSDRQLHEDKPIEVDSLVRAELRRSKLLHAVIVGTIRGDRNPGADPFLSSDTSKRSPMNSTVRGSLLRAFHSGEDVTPHSHHAFGVHAFGGFSDDLP